MNINLLRKKRVKHKFKAVRCEADGIKFPSKLERSYFYHLKNLEKIGEVVFFLRQVGFDLGKGVRHFVDYQVFWADGSVEFVEVKGKDLPAGKAKRKITESLYPIEITVVNKMP